MEDQGNKKNQNLQILHQQLIKDNYAVPADYIQFERTFSDPANAKTLFDQLTKDKYAVPLDFESFSTTFGLKKKDASDYGLPTKQVFEDMFSTISKENSEVSRKPVDYETQFAVPKPSFNIPEPSGYPQTLTGNLIGQVANRAYRDYSDKEKFKEYATAKLTEIDKELEGLKEYAPTVTPGAPPYATYAPPDKVSEGTKRREELLRQKGELRSALSDPKKWDFLLGQAINGSLVGMATKIYAGEMAGNENLPYELDPEWINKYDANWKESVAAMVMSLTLDGPMFKPLGIPGKVVGESGARFLTKKLVNDTAKKFIKTGIPEAEALKLAQKGAQKLSYAIPAATQSASSLGGYEGLANFLTQAGDPEKDLKDINYEEVLSSYGRGFALGLGTGLTGVGTAMAAQKAQAIPNALGRLGAQAGIQATGLAAESGVFSVGGALLDGKKLTDITKQDFGETVALLAALKISHAIQDPKATRLGLRRSLAYDPQKPGYGQFKVEMQPWEVETLGWKDYPSMMKELSKDDTKLGEVLSNDNVPAYLKQKLLWGSRGVAMENANIMADKVSINGEYVDFHNKEGVLVDRRKFYNREDAEKYGIDEGLRLEDSKSQMNGAAPEVDRVALLGKYKMQGGDVQKLFTAIDKDPATRTPEEWDMVGKFYSMIPKPKEPEKPTGGEEKPGEEKPEEVKSEEKMEVPEVKTEEETKPPAPRSLSQYQKGNIVQDKAGQQFEVVEPAKMGGGQAKLRNLKTKEVIGFDSQSIEFTPVQREITAGRRVTKTPQSIQKAIDAMPNDFDDVVRQYFLEGKKISREDFIANTGWGNEDIRKSGIGFFLSKEGAKLDVFHENVANSFGMEEKGAMDMANAITRILMDSTDPATNKISKWSVLKAFNKRRAGAEGDPFVPTQEDLIREREDNMTPDEVENEAPTVVDESKSLFEGDEVAQVFKSGRYETEDGSIDWTKLKDIADKNPEHFKEFPWNMTDKEFENLKTIINDTEKQRSVEKLNEKPGATEVTGEGDNLPGGVSEGKGRAEGEGKEKPKPPEQVTKEEKPVEKPAENLSPEQQKQIEDISKEYDDKISGLQKSLDKMDDEARRKVISDAEAEVNRRNTLFGDANAKETDLIKPGEQGFVPNQRYIDEEVRKFDERKVELQKQIDALTKEKESKIGEVKKQMDLFAEKQEEKPVEKPGKEVTPIYEYPDNKKLVDNKDLPKVFYASDTEILAIKKDIGIDPTTGEKTKRKKVYYIRKEGGNWEVIKDIFDGENRVDRYVMDRNYERDKLKMPNEGDFYDAQQKFGEALKSAHERDANAEYEKETFRLRSNIQDIQKQAESEYEAELKKAKLFGKAKEGTAPQDKIDEIKARVKSKWQDKVTGARKALEDFVANKEEFIASKISEQFKKPEEPKPPTTNKAQREALDDFIAKLSDKGGTYVGSEESSAGLIVKYKLKGDKSEREATIFKDGQMTPGAYGEAEKPLPKKGDQIKFSRGGRDWTADVLHVYPDGRVDVDVFGRKTINPDEYTIVPKKGGGGGGVESFRDTPRAKNQKKLRSEPLAENPEEIAWNEPLPISTSEDPNFKMSDLNDSMSIRNIARNFVKNLGLREGMDVRSGMISRFARKARAIFNPTSGIIRVKSIRDLRALIHEIGHKIDFEIFDMRGIVGARYADKNLGPGVDYNGKVYSTREQVERDFKNGTLTKSEANNLLPSVDKYIKAKGKEKYSEIVEAARIKPVKFRNKTYKTDADILADKSIPPDKASELLKKLNTLNKDRAKNLDRLRQKFGADVVDGVMQREAFKKELDGLIKDIGYPQNKRTEAIAEFVYNYIADKRQVINSTPNFLAWFEKLLDNAPELKEAFDNLKKDFATYDAQDVLTKAVAEIKTPEDEKTPFLDGIVKIKDNFLYSFVNQLQYMKNLSEEWKKIVGDAYESFKDPFISAKQMLGIDGRVQQWLLHNPYFKRGGEIILRKDIKPLMQIVKPLIGKPEYEAYKAYLVALDSIESHNRNKPEQAYFDRETAQAVKKVAEERFGAAKMIEFQGDIQRYNEALLDFMVESGRISKKTADYWKQEHQNYVPLRRIAEEYEILKGKKNITRDMLPESEKVIFARKGSQKQLKDIFESMIENTYKIIASSERNLLDRNILDAFKDIDAYNKEHGIPGKIMEEINEKDMEVYRDITTGEIRYAIPRYRPKNFRKPKGRIMGIYEEGVPRYYDIAKEYYNPLFQGTQQMNHALQKFIRIASAPSRWLQAGAVVYDPTFPIRNIARDQMSAWFYSKHKYMPTEFIKGVASFLKHDDYYQKWLASGGDQSFLVSADMMMSKEYADKKIGTLTRRKFDAYKKNPLLALQDFSKASEIGTRLGAFRNAYKRTGDVNQAAIESRDVSADYGIKGQAVRNILPFYPFLNARTQHARMTIEAMKRPLEFTAKGMAITVPAILNWLVNNQDEESRKLYQSLPTWRRVGLFNIRIPGTDHFLPLPKGFFGVMFGSSVESILDSVVGDDPRVADEIAKQLFQELSPAGNKTEVIPFVARPIVEMWANKKGYTGKPIVSESMKLLKPSEQYYNSTPEIIKKMGEALNWSPVKIEHYFRSYTGGAGIGAVNILDATLQAMGIVDRKPEDSFTTLSRMPVFKALLTEKPIGLQSGYVSDFYDTLDKIEKVNTTFNKYVATDNMEALDKFMQDPENKRMYEFYEGNSTALNAFRSALTYARDSGYAIMKDETLSSAEKQEQIRDINNVVQESAIKFKEAYENNEFFDYGKAMDEIITKMREEKKDYRKDLSQQQLTYNPYYVQMREKDATVFNLLKEFGGLHEIEQRRKLSRGMETIDLELEDVRRFNESVVTRYATNVKNSLGTNRKLWETQQGLTQPGSPEKTQLQAMFEMAWSSAVEQTKGDFQPTQYKRVE